jgi:hypothetical protein
MTFAIKDFEDLPEATLPLDGSELVVIVQGGVTKKAALNTIVVMASYTVATLPSAAQPGQLILVTDEVGGAVPAFSDNFNTWRRVTDRAVVS